MCSRSPRGERGLKYAVLTAQTELRPSLPARGAWIEMSVDHNPRSSIQSLPARGAWIEIAFYHSRSKGGNRRSPRGERGLKSHPIQGALHLDKSLPARGAWIEMAWRLKP